jgi:hypothetical protein
VISHVRANIDDAGARTDVAGDDRQLLGFIKASLEMARLNVIALVGDKKRVGKPLIREAAYGSVDRAAHVLSRAKASR